MPVDSIAILMLFQGPFLYLTSHPAVNKVLMHGWNEDSVRGVTINNGSSMTPLLQNNKYKNNLRGEQA